MHYSSSTLLAFGSVEAIMRDVNSGWLLRYLHANGASFFFIAVYIHIFRGMYYGSYKQPRRTFVDPGLRDLPFDDGNRLHGLCARVGQMSFWGTTVITGFFTAFPIVGEWSSSCCLAALRSTIQR